MKSFQFVFYQFIIFMASYHFCQAAYDFYSFGWRHEGTPDDDATMAETSTPVWIRKYKEINRFDIISQAIAEVEGADTANIIMSFKPDQVEPILLYTEFSNIIVTDEIGRPNQYHFMFAGDRENTQNFIKFIRPESIQGDIQLNFEIEEVIQVDKNLHKASSLVRFANIFERDINGNMKTFTIRDKDSSKPYLIVASQQFHVSEPYERRGNQVILFLSRATEVQYVFIFKNNGIASNFANKMKTYTPDQEFTQYNRNWNEYY